MKSLYCVFGFDPQTLEILYRSKLMKSRDEAENLAAIREVTERSGREYRVSKIILQKKEETGKRFLSKPLR